ncbi:MAG: antibiotic biosynthesis monooxygenase [Kiritimatiellae bacterium]|nr:antibiotic biosynthesis monooxygenase [Kiritimatiellia bacterium]
MVPDIEKAIFRIAEIEVKPEFLDAYLAAAGDVGATSVREEPGVLCIFPMQDAERPTSIRIVEIYRDGEAYKSHLATPHFLRYKTGTPHMIESLRLAPMRPLDPSIFPRVFRKSPTAEGTNQ